MNRRIVSLVGAGLALLGTAETAQAQASASAYTSGTRYDVAGRVTGTISPNDAARGYPNHLATRTTYDGAGRPIKVESGYLTSWQSENVLPANWPVWTGSTGFRIETTVETAYDVMGRKTKEWVKGSDGNTYSLTQYSYDSYGRLECTAVRMNPAVYTSLPASACALGTEGSYGPDRITKNIYDAAGQLLQVREGVGTSIEAADVTYGYTSNGKTEYVVDAGGNKARLCYDGHDRQSRWVFPSPTAPGSFNDATPATALSTAGAVNGDCSAGTGDYEQYGYDANGNRMSLRKRNGSTLTYGYDGLNRMTVKVVPGSTTHTRDVYYGYDLRGLQTYARFDSTSGEGVTLVYDGFGRKTSETLAMDGVTRTLGSQYDRDGNRRWLTHPDSASFEYRYDGLDRFERVNDPSGTWLSIHWFNAAGRHYLDERYHYAPDIQLGYDLVGRQNSHTIGQFSSPQDVSWTFGYNAASQIISEARNNDLYAFIGNVNVNRSYTANGLNQYSAVAGTSFGYDANGNLTSDGTNSFTYDVENRLVTRSGGATATLRYDPLGRLYEVTGTSGTRRFLYDGNALVAEYSAAGTQLYRYVHGTGVGDDPLASYGGSSVTLGNVRFLFRDARGSIVLRSDTAGTSTAINTYDEYGIPGPGNVGAFQYTGQAWLPELGMYYYKARMYSPTLGRFMQTDPIGYEDQVNLYAYVGNDPVNGVDPNGQQAQAVLASTCTPGPQAVICAGAAAATVCAAISSCREGVANAATAVAEGVSSVIDDMTGGDDSDSVPASDRNVTRGDNGGPEEPKVQVPAPTPHGQERSDQARAGDDHRQVGDPNRVVREGRTFRDTETGYTVHVRGDRVVITNSEGQRVTQWSGQSRANTQNRIRDGRWEPQ